MSPRSNATDPLPYLPASAGKPSHGRRYHDPDIDICWAPDHCRRTAVSLSVLKYASNLLLRHRGGHIVNADSDCAMAGQIQGPYYKTFLSDGAMTDAPGNIGMSPKNTELKCCTGRNDAPQHGQWSGHSNGKAHASASLFLLIWGTVDQDADEQMFFAAACRSYCNTIAMAWLSEFSLSCKQSVSLIV